MTVSVSFREYGHRLAGSGLDFDTDDVKVTLLLENHNADKDQVTLSAITLDECDSATFTFAHAGDGRLDPGTQIVNKDVTARVDFDMGADSLTWAALAAAAGGPIAGALVHVVGSSDDTTAYPIAYCSFGGTAVAANGQDFIVNWDAGNSRDCLRWTFS